jgi:single-strand DNA-binding protein
MNNLIITGNLGKDPELKFSADAKALANFSLAVGQRVKVDGVWIDGPAMWFQVKVFGPQAEKAVDRLRKGDTITVSGRIGEAHWMTKEGGPASSLEIYVNDFHKVERATKQDEFLAPELKSKEPESKSKDAGAPF